MTSLQPASQTPHVFPPREITIPRASRAIRCVIHKLTFSSKTPAKMKKVEVVFNQVKKVMLEQDMGNAVASELREIGGWSEVQEIAIV